MTPTTNVRAHRRTTAKGRPVGVRAHSRKIAGHTLAPNKPIYPRCSCGGLLGVPEHQEHSNPLFREYRTCLKCGYQWAKAYYPQARRQGREFAENETLALKK